MKGRVSWDISREHTPNILCTWTSYEWVRLDDTSNAGDGDINHSSFIINLGGCRCIRFVLG